MTGLGKYWIAAVMFIAFNIVITPIQYWGEMIIGLQFNNVELLWHPMREGTFYFYSVVLYSDALFRAFQYLYDKDDKHDSLTMTKPPDPMVFVLMITGFVLIVFTLVLYGAYRYAVATQIAPEMPMLAQIIVSTTAIIIDFAMHMYTAKWYTIA